MGRFVLGVALAMALATPAMSAHATTILTFEPDIPAVGIHVAIDVSALPAALDETSAPFPMPATGTNDGVLSYQGIEVYTVAANGLLPLIDAALRIQASATGATVDEMADTNQLTISDDVETLGGDLFGNQMVDGHWSLNGVPIIAAAPEPGSLALVFSALIGMLGFSRRA